MPKLRTEAQRMADAIDSDLARNLMRAEKTSEFANDAGWQNVIQSLRAARLHVRLLMNPNDRDATR